MKESSFQFTNPLLLKIDFKINDKCNFEKFDGNINPDISLKIVKEEDLLDQKSNSSPVKLKITIDNIEYPFILDMEIAAIFKWDESINEDKIQNLLNVNAPALLLSYARPIITNITQQSGLPPYNIPFMNFTEKE